jgi:hypothetical protein
MRSQIEQIEKEACERNLQHKKQLDKKDREIRELCVSYESSQATLDKQLEQVYMELVAKRAQQI